MSPATGDDDARIPLAIIGIALLLLSTFTVAMVGASRLASQQYGPAGELGRMDELLFTARGDLGRALNYAVLQSCDDVGRSPLIQGIDSNGSGYRIVDDFYEIERITVLATDFFDEYLDANYRFLPGDTRVAGAFRTGNVTLSVIEAAVERGFEHPLWAAYDEADTYFVASVPLNITIPDMNGGFAVVPVRIETLVTTRYPLLRSLAEEFEGRLNGASPLTLDVTAGTVAYTWARGYLQYATGEPENIIDNEHMALMANGAIMLEQASTFNSVDPMGLAHFGVETLLALLPDGESVDRTTELMKEVGKTWWMEHQNVNWQQDALDSTADAGDAMLALNRERSYEFNLSGIVQEEWTNFLFDGELKRAIADAYTANLALEIEREVTYSYHVSPPGENWSYAGAEPWEVDSFHVNEELFFPDAEQGYLECVNYSVQRNRQFVYVHDDGGQTAYTTERMGEHIWLNISCPVYSNSAGTSNDITNPFQAVRLDQSGGYVDPNLNDAASAYRDAIGLNHSIGSRDSRTLLYDILVNNRSGYTDGAVVLSREVVCGHNHWVEYLSWEHLGDIRNATGDIGISILERDYFDPGDMMIQAGSQLDAVLRARSGELLGRANFTNDDGMFESAGTKAVYSAGASFFGQFGNVSGMFENAAAGLAETVDTALENTAQSELDTDTLIGQMNDSRPLLDYEFVLPLGSEINLTFPEYPGWSETVRVGLDQTPDYLNTTYYSDEYTGYDCYTMKVKNICLFTIQLGDVADMLIGSGFDLLDREVLLLIDGLFSRADEFVNTTLGNEIQGFVTNITGDLKDELVDSIYSRIANDSELGAIFDNDDLTGIIGDYLDEFGRGEIIHGLADGSLIDGLAETLRGQRAFIAAYLAGTAEPYLAEYLDYLCQRAGELAREACVEAISGLMHELKDEIQQIYLEFSEQLEEEVKAGVDGVLSELGELAFSGLPILPPFGWWFTINVWYVEVQGDIPGLTVYDTGNHPHMSPLFGHQPQVYVREFAPVFNASGDLIGYNLPVHYKVQTASFILVPPGGGGVGDRTGGWEEASEGFEQDDTSGA